MPRANLGQGKCCRSLFTPHNTLQVSRPVSATVEQGEDIPAGAVRFCVEQGLSQTSQVCPEIPIHRATTEASPDATPGLGGGQLKRLYFNQEPTEFLLSHGNCCHHYVSIDKLFQ